MLGNYDQQILGYHGRLLALLALTFTFATLAIAQSHGVWTEATVCKNCKPLLLAAGAKGELLMIEGEALDLRVHASSDKGKSWRDATPFPLGFVNRLGYNTHVSLPTGEIFLILKGQIARTTNLGDDWSIGTYSTEAVAASMFSRDSGYAGIMKNVASKSTWELRASSDSGMFFFDILSESELPSFVYSSNTILLGRDTVVSSLNRGSNRGGAIARSSNSGRDWTITLPLDTSNDRTVRYVMISPGSRSGALYAVGGYPDRSEFVATTDFGKSWEHRSGSAAGRIFRLLESTDGVIWKLVGRNPHLSFEDLWSLYEGNPAKFADSLFYSLDRGNSWELSSKMLGEVVIDVIRSGDGISVLSYANGDAIVRSFTPMASVEHYLPDVVDYLNVYPNPCSTHINFKPVRSGLATLRLLDLLGNEVYASSVRTISGIALHLDLPKLLDSYTGSLFLSLEYENEDTGQWFVKY